MFWKQGDRDEGPDHGERSTEGPEDLQEDVLLHHAGRHAAASSDSTGGHDGEVIILMTHSMRSITLNAAS